MIEYTSSLIQTKSNDLKGFFVDWPNPPSEETLLKILNQSQYVILAKDGQKVVGFINAISDKVITAYIPLLEVLPDYQKQGIGSELTGKMLDLLSNFYMVDISCDKSMQSFYKKFEMKESTGMNIRNYKNQNGSQAT